MADDKTIGGRPSFTEFWKKEKQSGRQSRGLYEERQQGDSRPDQDKSLIRRQQVKRAQAQHRQRKANYLKQLEQDVSQLENLISAAQHEVHALKSKNEDIRSILRDAGVFHHPSAPTIMATPLPPPPNGPSYLGALPGEVFDLARLAASSPEIFSEIDVDEFFATPSNNDVTSAPFFYHMRPASSNNSVRSTSMPATEIPMLPQQEWRAMHHYHPFARDRSVPYYNLENGAEWLG